MISISTAGDRLQQAADACADGASAELQQGLLEIPGELPLYHGGSLTDVRLAWRLAGAAQGPVVLALGGISSRRTVYSSHDAKGWWDGLIGPGRAVDSGQYRILGIDFLGGSHETTGPGNHAGLPDNGVFPSVSTYDQAHLILRLLDHLNVARLHAIVGASYGGMVALAFAEKHPERVQRLWVIGAAHRAHPMATAWRCVQRRILREALQRGESAQGVVAARALAMATYRSPAEFLERFNAPPSRTENGFEFPVEAYLFSRGADYAAKYNAASFLCLSESIDLHAVQARCIVTPTTLVAVAEDQLVPPSDLRELSGLLGGPVQVLDMNSVYGHDAFLKESERLAPGLVEALAVVAG